MTRLIRACLQTTALEHLRCFYSETLGIPLLDTGVDSFSLRIGASVLEFRRGEAPPYHFAINIPNNLFEVAREWLAARVALLTAAKCRHALLRMPDGGDTMHWRAWNAHACYFRDTAGNIGELIARHNLAGDGAPVDGTAFDPAIHLLGISEIGLALDDVGESCRLIEEGLGLPVWDAGDGVRFRALGGERGLLICVKRGHAWFPTSDVRAEPAPLCVTFAGEEARELLLPGTDYVLRVVAEG